MITETIEAMIPDWLLSHGWDEAKWINNGHCNFFAAEVESKVPGARMCWDDRRWHCFVVYRGRFYDAEAPLGVDRPSDLPYYQRHKIKTRMSFTNAYRVKEMFTPHP